MRGGGDQKPERDDKEKDSRNDSKIESLREEETEVELKYPKLRFHCREANAKAR